MATFDAGRQAEMYQFFSVAFGAAPGTTYWGELQAAVESGMSTPEIVEVFTTKPQFLSTYPQNLSPEAFATRLVQNVVKDSATPAAKELAANQITDALGAGLSRGEVIYNVFSNLAARETDPTQPGYDAADPFLGVAKLLANQVKVAQYYTEVLGADSDSFGTLQSIISSVTDQTDVSTPAKLQELVGPLLFDAGQKAEMYQFFSVAFGAAPGTTYWGQLQEAVESGMSTLEIVEVFTTKPQFLSTYPQSLSPEDFATQLVQNVVKGSATPAAKELAANQIVEALGAGLSRGEVIYNVFSNLAALETNPAMPGYDPADPFLGAARLLANQIKVAQYYTEVLGADSDSLGTLQSILSNVTDQTDVSTPAKLQAIVDAAVAPTPEPGPTTTFTVANNAGMLVFGGNATGDITFTVAADGLATFVRGGVTATTKPNVNSINSAGSNTIKLAANATNLEVATAAKLLAITGFNANGKNYTLSDTLAHLEGAGAGVLSGAASYTLSDAFLTATALTDQTVAGLAAAQTGAVNAVRANAVVDGALNGDTITVNNGAYTLRDTLANLQAAGAVVTGAISYTLSDAFLTATALTDQTVAGLAAAQTAAVDAVRANAVVDGASNGDTITVNNGAYTLRDTLAHLQAAGTSVLNGAAALSLTDETVAAADLNTLDSKTTVAVNAAAVTALTGDSSDVIAVYAANDANTITGLGNEAVTLTDTSVSVADANAINAATSGVVTATLSGTAAELAELTPGDNAYTITVTDSATPAQLAAIDAATTLDVIYNTIADTAAALAANEGGFITGNANVTVTDTPTVAQLNTINAYTDGVVTATLSGTAAELAELTPGDNAYTITVTDAATLDQLATIDAATTLPLTYEDITGLAAALAADTTYVTGDHAVTVTDTATVAQLNVIDGHTSGVVTATVIEGDMATLANLTGTDNAYTVTVTDATVTAAALNTLDGKTTVAVNAAAVTSLTGNYSDVSAAYAAYGANTITGLGDEAVTLTDASVSAADANAIAAATTGSLTATITDGGVTATLAAIGNIDADDTISFTTTDTTVDASDFNALAALVDNFTHTSVTGAVTEDAASVASVATALTTLGGDNAATITGGAISVADANAIAAATSGVVTASITEGTINELVYLNGTGNAYDVTVTDTTVDAFELNTLDDMTTVAVNAAAVMNITGYASDVASTYLNAFSPEPSITGLGNEDVKLYGPLVNIDLVITQIADRNSGTITYDGTPGYETLDFSGVLAVPLVVNGNNGEDTITGGTGADTLNGGADDDTFVFNDLEQLDRVLTGAYDHVDGGTGTDTIAFTQTTALNLFVGAGFQNAVSDVEVLRVDSANANAIDVYLDNSSVDNTGINTVDLRGDTDAVGINTVDVKYSSYAFTVYGSAGNDTIDGATGNDTIDGGAGNDTIDGGAGADTLNGGDGEDTFIVADLGRLDGLTPYTVNGGAGIDTIALTQTTALNVFVGGDFQNAVSDVEVLRVDSANAFDIDVYLDWSSVDNTGIHTVDLRGDTDADGSNSVDVAGVITNFTVYGSAGDDTITGGSSADILYGEDGDDTFIFANLNQLVNIDTPYDYVYGGDGIDTITLTQSSQITFGGGWLEMGSIQNVEVLRVGADNSNDISITIHADAVYNTGLNTVDLSGDTDILGINTVNLWDTNHFNFTVTGSAGDDTITGGSTTGSVIVNAGDGDDTINGGGGGDTINGGNGNDTITSRGGADILSGGDGVDTFVFASGSSASTAFEDADTINDFVTGTDKINAGATPTVSVADNGPTTYDLFLVNAQNAMGGELQAGSVYVQTNVNSNGDAYVFMDTNSDDNVNTGDSFVVLIGVGSGLAVNDFVGGVSPLP